jgi:hypothetical protein
MSVITTGSHPKALWPGIKAWWGTNYKRHEPMWKQIFEMASSTQNYEEDVEDVGFGLLNVKQQGGSISYDTAHQGTVSRYSHLTYGLGYIVTMEELQDNLYEKVSFKRSGRLARSVYETEEIVHANVFNRAFSSTYAGGDGKELIATDHGTASGNQSNELTTPADLSEASLEDLTIQIMQATDSRGLKFSNNPKRLIVPPALHYEAHRIVKSVLQNDTANNAVNVLKMQNTFPNGILTWRYLTDPDAYFIQTDCMEGLKHYTRMAPDFMQDNDFDTSNLKAKVVARWSQGWSDWRQIYGSEGA